MNFNVSQILKLVLAAMILCNCTSSTNKNDCSNIQLISGLQRPLLNKELQKYNFEEHQKSWELISDKGMELVQYLLSFEGDSTHGVTCNGQLYYICYDDPRLLYFGHLDIPENDVAALHLINAIYYDNYNFASDRILYDTNNVIYETMINSYVKCPIVKVGTSYREHSGNYYTYPECKKEAWDYVKKWVSNNKDKDIQEIRKAGIRPLEGSSLFWYGEKGGLINKTYPNKFDKNYIDNKYKLFLDDELDSLLRLNYK